MGGDGNEKDRRRGAEEWGRTDRRHCVRLRTTYDEYHEISSSRFGRVFTGPLPDLLDSI